jgi:hypothetical protein
MSKTKQLEKQEQYFEIGFLLRGETQWGSGHTLGESETDAIRNFLIDFSPSMGTIVGISPGRRCFAPSIQETSQTCSSVSKS